MEKESTKRDSTAIQQNANNFRARQAGIPFARFVRLSLVGHLAFPEVSSISNVCLSCRYAVENVVRMAPRWPGITSLSASLHSLANSATSLYKSC